MTDPWYGRQVLVTGAGGFIGSHPAETLARNGARVWAFVRYNSRGDIGLLSMLPPDLHAETVGDER
jgi:nucleoside-diphosphate-sugar epimerase